MPAGFLLREIGGQPQRFDLAAEKDFKCVFVFPVRKSTNDGSCAGAFELIAGCGDAFTNGTDHRKALFIGRLIRLFRRHLFQGDLIDNLFSNDQVLHVFEREFEQLEVTFSLFEDRVMTFETVIAEKAEQHFFSRRLIRSEV